MDITRYNDYKTRIEDYLSAVFSLQNDGADGLRQAMAYSLEAGGKRVRPVLCLEFCRIYGGDTDKCLPVACALEMLHTYSLIHDDLPCMDDDDTRRGKPSCHKKFGETTAVLAGDCLQAAAFDAISHADIGEAERFRCCRILARAAGIHGICGGQFMDLNGAAGEDDILRCEQAKTASLMAASCAMGAAAAGGSDGDIRYAWVFGEQLGMAFQLRDDHLDGDGLCALKGPDECARLAQKYTEDALTLLMAYPSDTDTTFLRELAETLLNRAT